MADLIQTPTTEKQNINHISRMAIKRVCRNNLILSFIKTNPKINIYQITKALPYDYATISKVLKDAEYCGFVLSEITLSEENRGQKIYFIPEKQGEENARTDYN